MNGAVQETPHGPYRIDDRGAGLMLQTPIREQWQTLYEFGTEARPQIDLQVGSWFVSTHRFGINVADLGDRGALEVRLNRLLA